ncbi:MAG: ferric iron uptake transcriptional regulator [Acidiferrobacteraceae bacterium]|nr:ferric iron uptake transcriptional regulator [Acidiferrobacteraceae bacterium]
MSEKTDLKRAGLRTTQPRLKILEILENSPARHLGADNIYKKLVDLGEQIGLATVYRVLGQFESAGLVIRHNFEGGPAIFELNNAAHHDHMVCVECGQVVEFVDSDIEKRQLDAASQAGFVIHDHSLYLYGKCKECT